MDLRYNEQYIIHFNKLETIDESAINAAVDTGVDPLVVIQYDTNNGGKHLQIKMEPFNTDNVDKAVLPFVEKIQHFKKELRSGIKQGYVAPAVVPKDEYDKINAELAKLKAKEQKRRSAQTKYRAKQRETPKELTDDERLKKADYMREYAKKRREKQEQDALDKQLKLEELRKIAHTMTQDQFINTVFSFV